MKSQSPLENGVWHRLEVNQTGVYKIDYNFLTSLGLQNVSPESIKIYGYGGILPQPNAESRHGDIVENSIYFKGGNDGSISPSDYILFFAEGPDEIFQTEDGTSLDYEINPYADQSYYFITSSEGAGKRIEESSFGIGNGEVHSSLPFLTYHEEDNINLVGSGREWLGEQFRFQSEYEFDFGLTSINLNSPYHIETEYVGGSESFSTTFRTFVDDELVKTEFVRTVAPVYGVKGHVATFSGDFTTNDPTVNVRASYNNSGDASAKAYIDFIKIIYQRNLNANTSNYYVIPEAYRGSELRFSNTNSNVMIWDVSDITDVKSLNINNGSVVLSEETEAILVIQENNVRVPVNTGVVANQNLHGIAIPELLVIYNRTFQSSAERLLNFKENTQGIETEIVEIGDIFNEYSSGSQDVTAIRDFVRDIYLKDDQGKFKYLLLLGDCSFDYKDRLTQNTNFVPVYESRESYDNVKTFSSDDYFGLLGEDEGEWTEPGSLRETLEIGIGRIPAKSDAEAHIYLDKLFHYITGDESKGNWRNNIVFVADDGDRNLHQRDADRLGEQLEELNTGINVNKLYLDSYEQISSAGGEISPATNNLLDNRVEQGALIVNFSGHGAEFQWTQELIFTINQIRGLSNYDKLPFFITATCEFGRYDDPRLLSGAEELMFNPDGGAIGLMTTTRPVFANSNFAINESFYETAFIRNEDSVYNNLGDILVITKNNSIIGTNNRNFSLLGDPSMKLALPDKKIELTSINGNEPGIDDTLQALQFVELTGEVQNVQGVKDANFTGTSFITVFDKRNKLTTRGDGNDPFVFEERNSILFEGQVAVTNGEFTVEFIMPKDIAYQFGFGKLSFYAVSDDGQDANGDYSQVIIGGGLDGFEDNLAPEVELFMDDLSFISGGITGTEPTFIALISDENGVNTTNTGIGHEMTLVLDDDYSNIMILNEFYSSKENTFQEGEIFFPLSDISIGVHKLTFKVWDVNNNSAEREIFFEVGEDGIVTAFPNPFNSLVTFRIDQPRVEVGGDVSIIIHNRLGNQVWQSETSFDSFDSIIDSIQWDGTGNGGEILPSGVYFVTSELNYEDGEGGIVEKSRVVFQR